MPQVLVAVDWTSFHDKKTLVASVIRAHGRAIPVYYEICDHAILKRSQNACVLAFLTAMLDHRPGGSLRWFEQLLEDPTQLLAAKRRPAVKTGAPQASDRRPAYFWRPKFWSAHVTEGATQRLPS
jgi:hypothetical protein